MTVTEMMAGAGAAGDLLGLQDDFKDLLRDVLNFSPSNRRLSEIYSDAEVGVVEGLASQIRALASSVRESRRRLEKLEVEKADKNSVHKFLWKIEDMVVENARKMAGIEEDGHREHTKRMVEEVMEAMGATVDPETDNAILKLFLAALKMNSRKETEARRILRLVTSGDIGPQEIGFLKSIDEQWKIQERDGVAEDGVMISFTRAMSEHYLPVPNDEVFRLANAEPTLVRVLEKGKGRMVNKAAEIENYNGVILVSVTRAGRTLLEMLKAGKMDRPNVDEAHEVERGSESNGEWQGDDDDEVESESSSYY